MLRSTLVAAVLATPALSAAPASAQDVAWSVTVGSGGSLGAYVGIPGPIIAPVPVARPIAVYPPPPVYRPAVVVAAPGVYLQPPVYPMPYYAAPRVVYRTPVWVAARPYAYPVGVRWRQHGHRH